MVYVKRSVMVMEPMAESSIGVREGVERGKLKEGIRARGRNGALVGEKRKRDSGAVDGQTSASTIGETHERVEKKRKLKGSKGPNPLSVKKPKKERVIRDEDHVGFRGEDVSDVSENEESVTASIVVERALEAAQEPQSKKKRRRKHKPSMIQELAKNDSDGNGSNG